VCTDGNEWRSRRSFRGMGHMEEFDAELWAIGLVPDFVIDKRESLHMHGVKMVAVFSDSQAAIRPVAHLVPGPGQRPVSSTTEWPGDSLPTASQPRSTGSQDTLASPETKNQTVRPTSAKIQTEA